MKELTDSQLLRYSRQIMLPQMDVVGQERLLNATALVLGVGGLGSPVALYLASAGVGRLILVDDDDVELSNLQRQIAHSCAAIGQPKVESAAASVHRLNPDVQLELIGERPSAAKLQQLVDSADVVVDCSDNFSTRFQLNECCVTALTPLVSGAAIRLEGQVSVFDSRQPEAPCYRCLYQPQPDESLSCSASGVLAPLVGTIGSVQALEAVKLLTGIGQPLVGRVQFYDALSSSWREMRLPKDPQCPVCGDSAS
ncbi:molybdopterin-synthase adenylyltransferase MoeB [Gilvimarinus sp. SDUM040013]|uniref:Molybdopterin-synthase adenylyltransferase MoeB n=1 Tax=Gilvimarinus gilvus TaxID=3058038 RepID=A0ABU4S0F0_9GAMM|nr:molybdopterin-synthase adenylyltransferase MoeB [Gilvimarinus sp. SDUM040013]MDO3386075.1 molybdopterin-synthase adenylyltransferase MoeB [Gilvimarinus sp. SDUM040013]MDX6850384.1 molybdopterin-synthase adenylyltransferase MoeB [Gilvimarinus sp. SDUM040013]